MITLRPGTGWQTMLADLSLILFMITAAALSKTSLKPATGPEQPAAARSDPRPSPQSEPLAIYVAAPGAPPLAEWLAHQPRDDRQQLTVTARYRPGGQAAALAEAGRLAAEAGKAGAAARIVVEPGEGAARAVLAFDASDDLRQEVARELHGNGPDVVTRKDTP
ncbi:hypothetical protein [Novosphingobium album (ex Liu et al. 2023)]|uniref:Biopolymer transporter ExbD n=1 Tax=Novosphingobium album (ex Liu et al. 2023) TaxID=3031130 RepID=A0ABT5WM79_9SPHN|nr:hypothetical protein [Novosphingobium album (ex Liu et al. 2023)]MDE8651155.1 hypothetical protein [Novosphingobium album (ex Liu et al. 2023)]